MGSKQIFSRMKELFSGLTGKNKIGKEDLVLLKTALMLAAVDGEVAADEVARFKTLAEQCRGYSGESIDVLWDNALRSAGYLLIQSQFLERDELVDLFVRECEKDFVGEFALETQQERVHALSLLEQMAMADGDYSEVERAAIAALTKKLKEVRDQAIAERYSRAAKFDGNQH